MDPTEALKDVAKVAGAGVVLAAAMHFTGIQPNKAVESIIRPLLGWGDSLTLVYSVIKQKRKGKKGGELDTYARGTLKGMGLTSILHGINLSAEAVGFRSDTVRNMIKILFGSGDNLGGIFLGTVPENYKKLQDAHEQRKAKLKVNERTKLILTALRENWKTGAMTRGTIYANLAMFTALQAGNLSEHIGSEHNSTALIFEAATLGTLDTIWGLTLAIRDRKLKLTEEMRHLSDNLPLIEQEGKKAVYIKTPNGKMHFLGFQPKETSINFKSSNE
ncbi:hypothetical protein MYX07_01245 [Patescibacteria group bacterium AH-259-L07]|nr:hypothetical protein [Patescibacteria group bacterium AH-259-L07]